MRLLAEQQATLGAVELRAHAAANSDGMATIGVRLAIADRRPRELLSHLEATRRTTSLLAVSPPSGGRLLADLLAELRRVTSEPARSSSTPAAAPRSTPSSWRWSGASATTSAGPRPAVRWPTSASPSASPALGDRVLIEYANLDGTLLAVLVVDNRTTVHDLGPVDGLVRDIDACSHRCTG